jgi:hypothetical protein
LLPLRQQNVNASVASRSVDCDTAAAPMPWDSPMPARLFGTYNEGDRQLDHWEAGVAGDRGDGAGGQQVADQLRLL